LKKSRPTCETLLATTYAAVPSVHKPTTIITITTTTAIRVLKTPQPATMVPITQTGAIARTMDFAAVANPEKATEGAIKEATTVVTAVARNATFAASKAADRFVTKLTRKKKVYQRFYALAKNAGIIMDYAMFFAKFEGVNIGIKESESAFANNNNDVNAFFTFYNIFQQFLTIYGPINGQITIILFNNAAAAHKITGIDPFEERKSRKESHLFVFYSRYDGNIFQGIMPNTGAAGIFTTGEPQMRALQLKFPNVTMDSFIAGHKVKFGDNPESIFLETIAVETPFGTICFAIMLTNISFLLYLANINYCGVYFNNINNTLMHNGKKHPIVCKWGHL
jgi:hypothetical protein